MKKRKSMVRTDRVKDYSNIDKLLEDQFLDKLLAAINKSYL